MKVSLHYLAKHCKAPFSLMSFEQKISVKSRSGTTKIQSGASVLSQILIAKVTPLKNPQCENDLTPIHFAAYAGHLDVYKFLTEDVEDKNPRAYRRLSPLHLAAKNNNLPIYQCRVEIYSTQMHFDKKMSDVFCCIAPLVFLVHVVEDGLGGIFLAYCL